MIKTKKNLVLTIILLLCILITCCAFCFFSNNMALANTTEGEVNVGQPLGLMTKITLSIGAYSDRVWARARNDFTLGLSTVQVYVYLYSSLEYQTDYNNMKLENSAYIGDLNINKTLEVTAPIDGVKRYWRARVQSKLDNKDWQYKETDTFLVDENGKLA